MPLHLRPSIPQPHDLVLTSTLKAAELGGGCLHRMPLRLCLGIPQPRGMVRTRALEAMELGGERLHLGPQAVQLLAHLLHLRWRRGPTEAGGVAGTFLGGLEELQVGKRLVARAKSFIRSPSTSKIRGMHAWGQVFCSISFHFGSEQQGRSLSSTSTPWFGTSSV